MKKRGYTEGYKNEIELVHCSIQDIEGLEGKEAGKESSDEDLKGGTSRGGERCLHSII